MPNRADRAAAALLAQIAAHEPERPPGPWTCPECTAEVPAGEYFCDHAREDSAFSRDMRPRIRSESRG